MEGGKLYKSSEKKPSTVVCCTLQGYEDSWKRLNHFKFCKLASYFPAIQDSRITLNVFLFKDATLKYCYKPRNLTITWRYISSSGYILLIYYSWYFHSHLVIFQASQHLVFEHRAGCSFILPIYFCLKIKQQSPQFSFFSSITKPDCTWKHFIVSCLIYSIWIVECNLCILTGASRHKYNWRPFVVGLVQSRCNSHIKEQKLTARLFCSTNARNTFNMSMSLQSTATTTQQTAVYTRAPSSTW